MGRVEAFQVHGCRCWIYTGDHDSPHFHAVCPDEWEVRVYFLQEPADVQEKWVATRIPARVIRELRRLAAEHRTELLEQWDQSKADV